MSEHGTTGCQDRSNARPHPPHVAGRYAQNPAISSHSFLRILWLQVVVFLLNLNNRWRFRKMPGPAPGVLLGNIAEMRARMAPIAYTMVRHASATHSLPSFSRLYLHKSNLSMPPGAHNSASGTASAGGYSPSCLLVVAVGIKVWAHLPLLLRAPACGGHSGRQSGTSGHGQALQQGGLCR